MAERWLPTRTLSAPTSCGTAQVLERTDDADLGDAMRRPVG
jgi:hypothetical protein